MNGAFSVVLHCTLYCGLTVSRIGVRQVNLEDLSKQLDEDNIKVTMSDFVMALDEVKPAFGAAINTLEMCRY